MTGTLYGLGVGPGDPELLTLKALRVLQDADVIIHDRLVPEAVLERARRDAKRLYVGKARGEPVSEGAVELDLFRTCQTALLALPSCCRPQPAGISRLASSVSMRWPA